MGIQPAPNTNKSVIIEASQRASMFNKNSTGEIIKDGKKIRRKTEHYLCVSLKDED